MKMKKVLSMIVAMTMIATLLCVSAFAADGDVNHAVGTHGVNNTVEDGVAEIPANAGSSTDITLDLGAAAVNHRYAVDITFTSTTLTFNTEAIWNVNTYQYDSASTDPVETTVGVKIENHSDMPVQYALAGTVATADAVANHLTVSIDAAAEAVTVAKTDAGAIAPTSADASVKVTATPKTDWGAYLTATNAAASTAIGSITVTITAAP